MKVTRALFLIRYALATEKKFKEEFVLLKAKVSAST